MDALKQIFNSQEHVENYDQKTRRANWLGPEILFGLAFRYLNSGEKILDLGIGTGLTSVLFNKAGLQVYGMDFSGEMLKACGKKNIASDLKEHDMRKTPYPYESGSMDHAVCGGVMHIIENITPIFQEVSRIVREDGIFTFVCADHQAAGGKKFSVRSDKSNTTAYNHGESEIQKQLDDCGFKLLNFLEFFVFMQGDKTQKRAFRAYSAKKTTAD